MRLDLVRLDLVRLDLVRLDLVRLDLVRLDLVRLDLVRRPEGTLHGGLGCTPSLPSINQINESLSL